jgi:NADPH-dependent 2,4-dienoyl-CoA reductase/sulfur reductase-like enzyme/rhodanese-related sulfurtransferase
MTKILIVGGVVGGAAATRLRRLDEFAEIIVFERGAHVSYANCGMPYYIGGVIKNREALLLATPQSLSTDYQLDVRVGQEVVAIDRARKVVTVRRLDTGETYAETYDKLLLAPGAKPMTPPVPGLDLPGVFRLRSIADMDSLKAHVDSGAVRDAVVVGGGFIGLEVAENLKLRGLNVTIAEMLDQVLPPLDFEMAALVHRHLRQKNIRLALGDGLKGITALPGGRLAVMLASGRVAEADMVLLSIGLKPESDLARAAGLELGPKGHIVVNDRLQTSDPDIYAVGDAIQVRDVVTGTITAIPLAGPASRQARMAADNMLGRTMTYAGAQGSAIVRVFDLTIATMGLNARQLQTQGVPFRSSTTHSPDHPDYYPDATTMSIKLLYSPETGKLLGAQAVGGRGIDRTMNTLATALRAGMTVFDLEQLDLVYSPQYGSARDAVNIAGFVAGNWLRGDTELVQWDEIKRMDPERDRLLDVRSAPEHALCHVEGDTHIPVEQLRQRLDELDKNKRWLIMCQAGRRGYLAERILRQRGFAVANVTGGMDIYSAATEKQSNFDEWTPK